MKYFMILVLSFSSFSWLVAGEQTDPNVPTEFDTYWMAFLKKGTTKSQSAEEAAKIQSAHLAHLAKQRKEGKLLVAGPFEVEADANMRGIVLYSADLSLEEVQSLVDADPAVKTGRLSVEIIKWWTPAGVMTFPEHK